MPGVSQGGHRPGATEPGDQVAATFAHVSVGRDQGYSP
jgi:hypothetical protein